MPEEILHVLSSLLSSDLTDLMESQDKLKFQSVKLHTVRILFSVHSAAIEEFVLLHSLSFFDTTVMLISGSARAISGVLIDRNREV